MNLHLDGIHYSYSKNAEPALNGVSLSLDSHIVTGLAGANGSGKTTLIKVVLRQLIQYTGTYTIDSKTVDDRCGNLPFMYKIGYAPDIPVLDEVLTGYQILDLIRLIRGVADAVFQEEYALFKKNLDLQEWFETKLCREYSAGMRKKTSIAAAFLGAMRYVILDEPFNGLDPLSQFGLKQLIREKRERGTGALISSHNLDTVEKISDLIVLLKRGDVIFSGLQSALRAAHPGMGLEEIYCTLFTNT